MPSREEYAQGLERLAGMLRAKPMTARAIAKVLRCSKPVAHDRLRALQKTYTLVKREVREFPTGPLSVSYRIAR